MLPVSTVLSSNVHVRSPATSAAAVRVKLFAFVRSSSCRYSSLRNTTFPACRSSRTSVSSSRWKGAAPGVVTSRTVPEPVEQSWSPLELTGEHSAVVTGRGAAGCAAAARPGNANPLANRNEDDGKNATHGDAPLQNAPSRVVLALGPVTAVVVRSWADRHN